MLKYILFFLHGRLPTNNELMDPRLNLTNRKKKKEGTYQKERTKKSVSSICSYIIQLKWKMLISSTFSMLQWFTINKAHKMPNQTRDHIVIVPSWRMRDATFMNLNIDDINIQQKVMLFSLIFHATYEGSVIEQNAIPAFNFHTPEIAWSCKEITFTQQAQGYRNIILPDSFHLKYRHWLHSHGV